MNNMSTIIELDADHQIWNNELNDMKEEILVFEQILDHKTNAYNFAEIGQLQNQLRIHSYDIEKIKTRIQKCQLHSDTIGGSCFELVTENKENYHQNIGQMVDRQIDLFSELKTKFQDFSQNNNQDYHTR
jgi:chorismate synthase